MYEMPDNAVSQLVNLLATILIIIILAVAFSGCEFIEFIFKMGVVVGIIVVAGIVLLMTYILKKVSGRG